MKRHMMNKIVFIGAGNVASHLVPALHAKGYDICQIFSRTEQSARMLAETVGAAYTTDTARIDNTADIYIYSVSDSALPSLATRIDAPNALHLHTSGSTGMDVFAGQAQNFGVLYPLQTFSKSKPVNLGEVTFFIEANNDFARAKTHELAHALSDKVQPLDSDGRKRLHLAAVFVCNFTNHMYEIGSELLQEAGIDFNVLLPLIDETTGKIRTLSPYEAQTGPAVRNDRNIAKKHLDLLHGKRSLDEIYRLISNDIYTVHQKNPTC